LLVSLLSVFLLSFLVSAHEGPPYPILVDQPTDFGTFSIWTDPDVGEGTFILWIDGTSAKVQEFTAEMISQSHKNRETPQTYAAQRDPSLETEQSRIAFVGKIPFDHEGKWQVEFLLKGGGSQYAQTIDVDVTPPGPTQAEFFIYLVPFLVLGVLWALHALKRKSV